MNDLLRELERELEKIRSQNLYRSLTLPQGLDFCSNDYLGFSRDPNFRTAILEKFKQATGLDSVSSPASRLLRGNTSRHQALEQRLSGFKGTEAALIFPTGYQTNIGVLTALIGSQDRVLSDAQNHASIIDGLRLSGCQKIVFPHLDLGAVEEALIQPHPKGKTFLVTESLFSMDGDIAPLETYAELAKKYEANLIVDDAHAVGVFGEERGSGLTERFGVEKRALAIVSTFGKGFGLFGAFVAGPQVLIDYLINRCRSFIFTTAVPPLLLYGVEAGLDLLDAEPERRKRVCLLADQLRQRFKEAGLDTLQSAGPIVPVVLGKSERALAVAQHLQEKGLDVRAIRPPTVAPGTARLRISVHADHTEQQIDQLAEAVEKAVNRAGKR
jgi:8-amino-7-oxononanoate synthase